MNKPESIVVLNSGGFDSTILLHKVVSENPGTLVYSVHFNYGQNNLNEEFKCAEKNSNKLGCIFVPVNLPTFSWTTSDFYEESFKSVEKQELEYRNLVFLSYAVSIAESIGAHKIYAAILKSHYGYKDTSPEFFCALNSFLATLGIEVCTPFIECEKDELDNFAFLYNITQDDFFSCDTPVDGKPCGKCPDCLILANMMERVKPKTPFESLCKGTAYDGKEFTELMRLSRITEARLYTNNVCQLKCSHCYYGFDTMKGEPLSKDEYKDVIKRCVEAGITQFHFSGKEPLVDGTIFEYARYIKENFPTCTYDVVTNGINIPKFAGELVDCGFQRVCLSVDSLTVGDYRGNNGNVVKNALKTLQGKIPVTAFIDLSSGNCENIYGLLEELYWEYEVRDFYIRAICPIGNAENRVLLSPAQLDIAYLQAFEFATKNTDIKVTFNLPQVYVKDFDSSKYALYEDIQDVLTFANCKIEDNFTLLPEIHCGRYETQLTITPDGYVLGCASETAYPDYPKISAGNVKAMSMLDLIKRGKEIVINANKRISTEGFKGCTFFSDPVD